jgi:hypothetical protein
MCKLHAGKPNESSLAQSSLKIKNTFLTKTFSSIVALLKQQRTQSLDERVALTVAKPSLKTLASCLVLSLVVALIDLGGILLFSREPSQIASILSLIMLAEGGLGLTTGGVVAFYSPLGAKISEVFFRSEPRNATRQKEAETRARAWIITGGILVLAALLVSAL